MEKNKKTKKLNKILKIIVKFKNDLKMEINYLNKSLKFFKYIELKLNTLLYTRYIV